MKAEPWTADSLLGRHLAHRKSILFAYQNRKEIEKGLLAQRIDPCIYRNAYNSLLDAAMVTCRSLWELIGVTVPSRKEVNPANPAVEVKFDFWKERIRPILPDGIVITPFNGAEFDALPEKTALILVLVAANKCVAHLDRFPDHGVGDAELEPVVGVTLREIAKRIQKRL